jgi:hypothetical protein
MLVTGRWFSITFPVWSSVVEPTGLVIKIGSVSEGPPVVWAETRRLVATNERTAVMRILVVRNGLE